MSRVTPAPGSSLRISANPSGNPPAGNVSKTYEIPPCTGIAYADSNANGGAECNADSDADSDTNTYRYADTQSDAEAAPDAASSADAVGQGDGSPRSVISKRATREATREFPAFRRERIGERTEFPSNGILSFDLRHSGYPCNQRDPW